MNKEKYNDPTADTAMGNVMREEKKKRKQEGGRIGKKPEREGRGST